MATNFTPNPNYPVFPLCLWREARGEGNQGMLAVACVIANRAKKRKTSFNTEVMRPYQFSSMTTKGPWLAQYPGPNDIQWKQANLIVANITADTYTDITLGSTVYYNPEGLIDGTVPYTLPDGAVIRMPSAWNQKALKFAIQIGHHFFFTEV